MSVTRLFRAVSWLLLLVPLFGCPPETTEDDDDVVDDDDTVDDDDSTGPDPVEIAWVLLPPGTFTMGCVEGRDDVVGTCWSDESPSHEVTLTRSLWMAQTEITQTQWEALMPRNPSWFGPNGNEGDCGGGCPVDNVNWYEALAFANAVSAAEGLAECFVLTDCTDEPGHCMVCDSVTVNTPSGSVYDCEGYRLPTEAEWEYAARAGEDQVFAGSDLVDDVAWHAGNSGITTHPVGQLQANAWDLYDMSGNVAEWAWDAYSTQYYSSSPGTDPEGPPGGDGRVHRGGGLFTEASGVRVALRSSEVEGYRDGGIGFRLVRSSPDPR